MDQGGPAGTSNSPTTEKMRVLVKCWYSDSLTTFLRSLSSRVVRDRLMKMWEGSRRIIIITNITNTTTFWSPTAFHDEEDLHTVTIFTFMFDLQPSTDWEGGLREKYLRSSRSESMYSTSKWGLEHHLF